MADIVLVSVFSFLSTNLDDLFVLMFLFMQAQGRRDCSAIFAGRYIGTAIILAVGLVGAFGMSVIPEEYIGLLGIAPIALGVKEYVKCFKSKNFTEEGRLFGSFKRGNGLIGSSVMLTISNGADNIGVYIPLLVGYTAV